MHRPPRIVYQQGDHVCTLFSSREKQIIAAIEYIRSGLERGERCLYVCGEQSPAELRDELRRAGVDVEAEETRGAGSHEILEYEALLNHFYAIA